MPCSHLASAAASPEARALPFEGHHFMPCSHSAGQDCGAGHISATDDQEWCLCQPCQASAAALMEPLTSFQLALHCLHYRALPSSARGLASVSNAFDTAALKQVLNTSPTNPILSNALTPCSTAVCFTWPHALLCVVSGPCSQLQPLSLQLLFPSNLCSRGTHGI